MRVKPYAIRFPSRNARHTALSAPGGCMSTSGCSCRYRSSLRTCSGGPGGTSCTGQYRYPVSGRRNGFPKSHDITCYVIAVAAVNASRPRGRASARDDPGTTFASGAAARQHRTPLDCWLPPSAGQAVPGADRTQDSPPSCVPNSGRCLCTRLCTDVHNLPCSASVLTSQRQLWRNLFM
jgi:hypothetical protein